MNASDFEAERPRLIAIATRILGSAADAPGRRAGGVAPADNCERRGRPAGLADDRDVLDALVPAERAAFVLHDVFGYPFEEISVVLGRSGTAVRQLASRARRKVRGAPDVLASMDVVAMGGPA